MTKQDLLNQREQLQNDIMTFLDGMDDEIIDALCEMVVERFAILINNLEEK